MFNFEEVSTEKDNNVEAVDLEYSKKTIKATIDRIETTGKVSRNIVVSLEELTGIEITKKLPATMFTIKETNKNKDKLLKVLKENYEILLTKESNLPTKLDVLRFNRIFKNYLIMYKTQIEELRFDSERVEGFINGRLIIRKNVDSFEDMEVRYLDMTLKDFFTNFSDIIEENFDYDIFKDYELIKSEFENDLEPIILEYMLKGFPLYLTNTESDFNPITIKELVLELNSKSNILENIDKIKKEFIKVDKAFTTSEGITNTINSNLIPIYRELNSALETKSLTKRIIEFFENILK